MAGKKLIRMTVTPDMHDQIKRSIDWTRVDAMTEEEIERDLASDPDAASPLTEAEGQAIRVQIVRKSTGLSQPRFAERFRIPLGTLRDWEQARSAPDGAAIAYLRVIEREPNAVVRALEPDEV
jgi:putative transcriptional regulator